MPTEARTTITIRVRTETKSKMEILKETHPDVYWDALLEPILKDIRLPYQSLRQVNDILAHQTP